MVATQSQMLAHFQPMTLFQVLWPIRARFLQILGDILRVIEVPSEAPQSTPTVPKITSLEELLKSHNLTKIDDQTYQYR